jgi:hypothetical protein
MLSLILNRTVLLGVRFVGIFLVVMGLLACPPTTQPTHTSADEVDPQKISQDKWWGVQEDHDDSKLLQQRVILEECISIDTSGKMTTQEKKITSDYQVGAKIHPFSIRKQKWKDFFSQTKNNELSNSVLWSIVPYVKMKEKEYMIIPYLVSFNTANPKHKPFYNYYIACDSNLSSYVYQYPHYYPTIQHTPKPKNEANRDKLLQELKEMRLWSEVTKTLSKPTLTKKELYMADLLRNILTPNENVQFLQKLEGLSFQVWVTPQPPGAITSWSVDLAAQQTTPPPADAAQITETSSVQRQHTAKITLPEDFVNMFKTAKLKLTDYMRLGGCSNAAFKEEVPVRPNPAPMI